MFLDEVYFWTNTIKDWSRLLQIDQYKQIIIDSLSTLVKRKMIKVYGFVIMPNHIHLLWKMLEFNGKEMPHASFNKFTAHQIISDLRKTNTNSLKQFEVNEEDRRYRVWQRDPLAVNMFSTKVIEQKLKYIHNNPLQEHWNLATSPEKYKWSSAKFYEIGVDDFNFITHYKEDF